MRVRLCDIVMLPDVKMIQGARIRPAEQAAMSKIAGDVSCRICYPDVVEECIGLQGRNPPEPFLCLNEVSDAENTKASVCISGMSATGGTGTAIL